MTAKLEALVFDFDGVIADTEPLYWRAWREILGAYGVPFGWEEYCRVGRGIREEKMLESLADRIPDPEAMDQIRLRLPERWQMVQGWICDQPPISAGTAELLHSLAGRTLGMVTSSDREGIEPLLQAAGIADCFDACVFGEEITRHKPDPAPYVLIREKLGISGGVAFEDSDAGLLSASSAGFKTVRVGSPDELPGLVRALLKQEES